MGTDIHGVFQRRNKDTGTWEDIPSGYEQGRHYQLFAVLADVRNGYGFAGVQTGDAVTPISEPRGFPSDFSVCDDDHPISDLNHMNPRSREYHDEDDPLSVWMGDHSHSWLTGSEMLAWYENAPSVIKVGIIDREQYERWDKTGSPEYWRGSISGPNVVLVNDCAIDREANPGWTHIRCEWEISLKSELAYFFDEIVRLESEHGEVRFVFGFDS